MKWLVLVAAVLMHHQSRADQTPVCRIHAYQKGAYQGIIGQFLLLKSTDAAAVGFQEPGEFGSDAYTPLRGFSRGQLKKSLCQIADQGGLQFDFDPVLLQIKITAGTAWFFQDKIDLTLKFGSGGDLDRGQSCALFKAFKSGEISQKFEMAFRDHWPELEAQLHSQKERDTESILAAALSAAEKTGLLPLISECRSLSS